MGNRGSRFAEGESLRSGGGRGFTTSGGVACGSEEDKARGGFFSTPRLLDSSTTFILAVLPSCRLAALPSCRLPSHPAQDLHQLILVAGVILGT